MAEPFLGQIQMFAFNFAPRGWAFCNGQALPINQNQALYAILGPTYGGNGQTYFNLPDLRGRVPVHYGNGIARGESAGEETHALTEGEMPMHMHGVLASSANANNPSPVNNVWAKQERKPYSATNNVSIASTGMSVVGEGRPHENRQPYAVTNFCIALQGYFPSRD